MCMHPCVSVCTCMCACVHGRRAVRQSVSLPVCLCVCLPACLLVLCIYIYIYGSRSRFLFIYMFVCLLLNWNLHANLPAALYTGLWNSSSDISCCLCICMQSQHLSLLPFLRIGLVLQRQECQFFDVVQVLRCVPRLIAASAGSYQECIGDDLSGL